MTARIEPVATYRFQLTPSLGFADVVDLLGHVDRSGASHVYLSPIAEAVPGSLHGYDVVDHTRVRAELGGTDGFERLLDAVAARGMAVVIDHVPNHVAAARPELNPRWWELLRDGRASPAERWFDVDWEAGGGRVLLPVLGAPLAEVLADGQLAVDGDAVSLYGGARRIPLAAGTATLPLPDLLEAQHWRLVWWRSPERNVRRFFTIDDLVAVRVEHPEVAALVDTLPARYAAHAGFGGVRVDHVDGLADPLGYLRGLRGRVGPDALVWVEKIVVPGEWLPDVWPVDGTTGYEFMRITDQALLARESQPLFDALWSDMVGDDRPFHDWERQARIEVVDGALAPDADRVGRVAVAAVDADAARDELRRLTLELPRYRTYLPDDPDGAELLARISNGPVTRAILRPASPAQVELRTRWQQLTGPVMAKGAEDRSFYRYLRLASLCEVGGDPGSFGIAVDGFHADNVERQRRWPRSLLASSTHDTKRSGDVRARSTALTWRAALEPDRVTTYLSAWVHELTGRTGLDPVTAWLGVQSAIITPDADHGRLAAYLVKACREAATSTCWESPDVRFEERLDELAALVSSSDAEPELRLDTLAAGISLAATALRLTSPGVPDVYQGTEAFTYRLVDPDNRVPPNWDDVDRMVADERTVADLWAANDLGAKPVLVRTLLELRRRRSVSFGPNGAYRPIDVGPGAIAFGRSDDVLVVARRGAATVDTRLEFPPGSWYDVLDPGAPTMSGEVGAAALVGSGDDDTLPVAVFERD